MEPQPEKRWYIQRLPSTINATTPLPARWTDLVLPFWIQKGKRSAERTYNSKHKAVTALRDECYAAMKSAEARLSSADEATFQGRTWAVVFRREIVYYQACVRALATAD
jgi:hypothetical protein